MNHEQQTPNPTQYQSQLTYQDEISLVDIVRVLLRRKSIIFGITVITLCIGLVYAFSQKKVYQVETLLLPPSTENIQALNVINKSVSSGGVFSEFISNANSTIVREEFFNNYKITEALSNKSNQDLIGGYDNVGHFLNSIKVNDSRIILEGTDKDRIGVWLDSFVEKVNQETKTQLVKKLQFSIDSEIKNLEEGIIKQRKARKFERKNELKLLEIRRKDELNKLEFERKEELRQLERAYQIANILGIHKNLFEPYSNYLPHMKGTKLLKAEIRVLKNQKLGDVYIKDPSEINKLLFTKKLRNSQEKLAKLKGVKIDRAKLQTVIVGKKAVHGIKEIRTNRKLIAILSLLLGGLLGIIFAFTMEYISKLKKQLNNDPNFDAA